MNKGLATLQFQSLSINPKDPLTDIMGGTQDNGTWAFNREEAGEEGSWFETIGGDGGQSGVDVANPNIRFHNYYDASPDINFNGTAPLDWDWIADPLFLTEPWHMFGAPRTTAVRGPIWTSTATNSSETSLCPVGTGNR
jgi:hypothetical protein